MKKLNRMYYGLLELYSTFRLPRQKFMKRNIKFGLLILGFIPLSQISKFIRCASPKSQIRK
jgi:hypothetical protein